MNYHIKQDDKDWLVITPEGRIANEHKHPAREQAERHCEALIAFFGRTVADNETK